MSRMTTIISKGKNLRKTARISIHSRTDLHLGRRIICPHCGNDRNFYEIAEDVTLTTRYVQNCDGSFTPHSDDSRILGDVKLYCEECQADLIEFHNRFLEMLF